MKREYKKSTHTARFQKLSIMLSIRQNEENMQYPIRYYMYNKEWYHVQVILWTINTESSKRHGQNKSCETETPNVTFNIFFNATKKLQGLVTRIKHQIWRRLRNIWVKMMPPPQFWPYGGWLKSIANIHITFFIANSTTRRSYYF